MTDDDSIYNFDDADRTENKTMYHIPLPFSLTCFLSRSYILLMTILETSTVCLLLWRLYRSVNSESRETSTYLPDNHMASISGEHNEKFDAMGYYPI